MKTKKHKNLKLLLLGITCFIFCLLVNTKYFVTKHKNSKLKLHTFLSRLNINNRHIQTIQTWLHNTHTKMYINPTNLNTTSYYEFNVYKKSANKTIFFNSTKTFHKLLKMWLDKRFVIKPLQVEFTMKPEDSCINSGQNLSILIAVTSSASHQESRSAIRDTWGSFAKSKGAKVLFFLGVPENTKYHSRIIDENIKFQDIVQSSFSDTYANLTLKSISMLKWVTEACSLVKYVLKVDDDMFINFENIINMTENKSLSMVIFGELAHDWPPVRSIKSKWYSSYQDYPFNIYPDFVFGPSYLLSGDAVKLLYDSSIRMKTFHLEDVYITGFVAEKENIQRVNLPTMFNTIKDLQPCNFKRLLSSHGHTPPDIRRHWMWLNRKRFQCI